MNPGVVLARVGSAYRVITDAGECVAVLSGKLKHADGDRVVAGDVVELDARGEGPVVIRAVRPRRSVLARRAAAGERMGRRAQPLAANVDQVVVVQPLNLIVDHGGLGQPGFGQAARLMRLSEFVE